MRNTIIIVIVLLSLPTSVYAQIVHIPDPNLRAAVREALNIPDDKPLTQDAMLTLTKIHVQGLGIADLTGLEFAQNLTDLHIGRNSISDISIVGTLTHLRVLRAHGCQIADLTPLANLVNLEWLNLHRNKIRDVTPLAELTRLKHLSLHDNLITDHSPLDRLDLEHFTHDLETVCDMAPLPLKPRIENRNFPSLITGWSDRATWPSFDLIWCCPRFDTELRETKNGFEIRTRHASWEGPIAVRDAYLQENPTMVFLAGISVVWNHLHLFPEDSPYWLRDENGAIRGAQGKGSMDMNHPGWQQWVIDRAAAIDQCGLYDGIFIDGWGEPSHAASGQLPGQVAILKGIRERVRDDFLILVNTNDHQSPASAPYINGLLMETVFPWRVRHAPEDIEWRLTKIENTLKWAEQTLRKPRINALIGLPYDGPLDSPVNLAWMRVFITMNLTHSDGYALFMTNEWDWHDFWDADLGRPIGAKSQLYRETPGLYIREFTNGWAVYNHSGSAQIVTLPEQVQSAAHGFKNTEHAVPNLDGDIFLRIEVEVPGDLNGDGAVTILDLVIVAEAMGTDKREADVNGDGVINVFDLVMVANAL